MENGIPHDKNDVRGIAHARTNRKKHIFMQRRLYIDEAHTALDIFRFASFFLKKYAFHHFCFFFNWAQVLIC